MADKLNLFQIIWNSIVDSYRHRQNYSWIQSTVNSIIDEIANLSASTSTSEIITSRDGHATLYDRLRTQNKLYTNGVINTNLEKGTDLQIKAQGTPDMTVQMQSGSATVDGSF